MIATKPLYKLASAWKFWLPALCCCACIALSWIVFGSPASAKNKADIVDIDINRERENLEISFRIDNCFNRKMEEAVQNGVPTTFRILVVLEKTGGLSALRSPVLSVVIEHTIKYDRIKNHFRIELPEHPEKELITADFEEAKLYMSSVKGLPLIPLWRLEKNQMYELNLKAELSKFDLPFFFRYIFFFVSMWDFETDWQKLSFKSIP